MCTCAVFASATRYMDATGWRATFTMVFRDDLIDMRDDLGSICRRSAIAGLDKRSIYDGRQAF